MQTAQTLCNCHCKHNRVTCFLPVGLENVNDANIHQQPLAFCVSCWDATSPVKYNQKNLECSVIPLSDRLFVVTARRKLTRM